MARLQKQHYQLPTYHLCFILLLFIVSLASIPVAASDSSALCSLPTPVPNPVPVDDKEDALKLLQSFQITAGYFVGGEEIHFAKEENDEWSYAHRSISLFPHIVERTEGDSGHLHIAATLTLSGGRSRLLQGAGGRQRNRSYLGSHTVSFTLNGYYSSTSGVLCMIGAGAYSEDDGTIQPIPGVTLKLRFPNPARPLGPVRHRQPPGRRVRGHLPRRIRRSGQLPVR